MTNRKTINLSGIVRNRLQERRMIKAGELIDHPSQWRDHSEAQAGAMVGVLKEVGIASTLKAWHSERAGGKLVTWDGHLRKSLDPDLEWPVDILDITDQEADYLLSVFDPLSAMATADAGALDALLSSVNSGEAAVQKMLAELAESAGLYAPKDDNDAEPQIDRAEELREQWGVEPGQMWRLPSRVEGQEHRLVCGDCTDAAVVGRVMGGEKAALCFTSPPYAQQRDYDAGGIVDWDALMRGAFLPLRTTDDAQVLVNLGIVYRDGEWWPYWDGWIEWMRQQGWKRFGWYVWDKLCGLPGDHGGRLSPAHEFVFHFCRKPIKPNKNIPTINAGRIVRGHNRQKDGRLTKQTGYGQAVQDFRIQDSVFRRGAEKGEHGIDHPAVMSSNFADMVVDAYPGDTVYEPFSGSGTTIIAAENLSRQCRAVEISPAYVAVALQRYADAFGITSELID